jgi:hypothetical protein
MNRFTYTGISIPMRRIGITLLMAFLALFTSCSTERSATSAEPDKDVRTKESKTPAQTTEHATDSSQCDASLWDHVYNRSRLEVIEPCKVVTGTVEELDQNEDGDTHMLLKLDAGYENLLFKRNKTKKDGNLVIEVVCANAVTDKKVGTACNGYSNKITIPSVGDHIRVTGSYVNDSHNDWAEIHPVSSIQKQ